MPYNLVLRIEVIKLYYNNLLISYFGINKILEFIIKKNLKIIFVIIFENIIFIKELKLSVIYYINFLVFYRNLLSFNRKY